MHKMTHYVADVPKVCRHESIFEKLASRELLKEMKLATAKQACHKPCTFYIQYVLALCTCAVKNISESDCN